MKSDAPVNTARVFVARHMVHTEPRGLEPAMETPMFKRIRLLLPFLLAAAAVPAGAQDARVERDGALPRDVAREVASVWNAPATRRERGAFILGANDTVRGDVAVLEGSANIAGVVIGQVVVINGDASLASTARIGSNLTVVGGTLDRSQGTVDGDIRVWRARIRYREVDGDVIPEPESELVSRWQRWRRFGDDEGRRSELFLSTAHTYNRVEGLPIYFGPRLRVRNGATRYDVEVYGIFRIGESLDWTEENLGYRLRVDLQQGRNSGVGVGARFFDEVAAVEQWQLTNDEVGLASFLFSRDYRDYWNRHGGSGSIRFFTNRRNSLTLSYGEEHWTPRNARDPWTLFNHGVDWRLNPAADMGVIRLFGVNGVVDTRNDVDNPRTGWLLSVDYERGSGDLTRTSLLPVPLAGVDGPRAVEYGRAFLDVRRYNRLGPNAQLNLRAVLGGWMHGDPLPQQRRLSVSGVDALPGYDFRRLLTEDFDVGTCVAATAETYSQMGRPANCQRILLLQAEWKGDFRIHLFGEDDYGDARWYTSRFNADGTWVIFANGGRGWIPGSTNEAGSTVEVESNDGIPPLGTWRTDIGGGFDFGAFGVYVAKAVTNGGEKPNFFVRLGRRF